MWETIKQFFIHLYDIVNGFLRTSLDIDGKVISLYNQYVSPIPELFKILGAAFLVIIIVFGVLGFVKKLSKLFIALAVILLIVFIITRLV